MSISDNQMQKLHFALSHNIRSVQLCNVCLKNQGFVVEKITETPITLCGDCTPFFDKVYEGFSEEHLQDEGVRNKVLSKARAKMILNSMNKN